MSDITPRVDIAFKKIFGVEENKDLLISLVNSIVDEEDQVKSVELLNPYNPRNFKKDKLSILDIKARSHEDNYNNYHQQQSSNPYGPQPSDQNMQQHCSDSFCGTDNDGSNYEREGNAQSEEKLAKDIKKTNQKRRDITKEATENVMKDHKARTGQDKAKDQVFSDFDKDFEGKESVGKGVKKFAQGAPVLRKVKRGDTLSEIASAHGVSVQDILETNPGIKDANKIYAGQEIVIPVAEYKGFYDGNVNTDCMGEGCSADVYGPPPPPDFDNKKIDNLLNSLEDSYIKESKNIDKLEEQNKNIINLAKEEGAPDEVIHNLNNLAKESHNTAQKTQDIGLGTSALKIAGQTSQYLIEKGYKPSSEKQKQSMPNINAEPNLYGTQPSPYVLKFHTDAGGTAGHNYNEFESPELLNDPKAQRFFGKYSENNMPYGDGKIEDDSSRIKKNADTVITKTVYLTKEQFENAYKVAKDYSDNPEKYVLFSKDCTGFNQLIYQAAWLEGDFMDLFTVSEIKSMPIKNQAIRNARDRYGAGDEDFLVRGGIFTTKRDVAQMYNVPLDRVKHGGIQWRITGGIPWFTYNFVIEKVKR